MFNLPVEEVCSCARNRARELKSKIKNVELSAPPTDYERPVNLIEEWWRESMIAANPETPDAVERFMWALSFDLRERVANGFSEKDHIWYECHKGCCGSYGGLLAVYVAVAGCDLFLPDGFCPDGDEMIFAPHGVMITRSVFWENCEDEDDFMWHTVVKEALLNKESCVAILSSALWLRDYIVSQDDDDDDVIGNLDLLYKAVAERLRKADLDEGVTWRNDDLNEIIQESGSTISAPDVSLYISTQRVGVTMTDDSKIVIFPYTTTT